MQRLASQFTWSNTGLDNFSSHQFRSFASRHGSWPYAPTQDAHSHPSSSASSSSTHATQTAARVPARGDGLVKTMEQILDQIRHLKGVRDIWEVAVKRNGMTTSLALLGGVLFADMILYRPKSQQVMQTSLAASNGSSGQQSSSSSSGDQQSDSTHRSSEHKDIAPRLAARSILPAHA